MHKSNIALANGHEHMGILGELCEPKGNRVVCLLGKTGSHL
jgi:hypothetical protein